MYAFCNTHDITWGTKGDDKAEKLPSAHTKPGGKVDVNIPQDDGDLNAQYDAEMRKIAMKAPKEVKVVSDAEKQEDYYKGFRSAVVLAWMFCNFALAAVVLSTAGIGRLNVKSTETQRSTIYMAVVLWSVAGLSAFRFIGAMWFLVVRMVSPFTPLFTRVGRIIAYLLSLYRFVAIEQILTCISNLVPRCMIGKWLVLDLRDGACASCIPCFNWPAYLYFVPIYNTDKLQSGVTVPQRRIVRVWSTQLVMIRRRYLPW